MQPESMVQKDGSKGIKFVMEHGPPPVRFLLSTIFLFLALVVVNL
jgi:hypothetical protein